MHTVHRRGAAGEAVTYSSQFLAHLVHMSDEGVVHQEGTDLMEATSKLCMDPHRSGAEQGGIASYQV